MAAFQALGKFVNTFSEVDSIGDGCSLNNNFGSLKI